MDNALHTEPPAVPLPGPDPTPVERGTLREACEQFEGLLLGMILKESLREPLGGSNSDSAVGLDSFREFCIEHVAASLAKDAPLGLADMLTERMEETEGARERP